MRLAEARRLKPGDVVLIEGMPAGARRGSVVAATKRGGVLVRLGERELWFPYPRVTHASGLMREVSSMFWK